MTAKQKATRRWVARVLARTAEDAATENQLAKTADKPQMTEETKQKIAKIKKVHSDKREAVHESALRFYPQN